MVTHVRVRFDGKSFVPETPVDIATDRRFDIDLHPLDPAESSTRTPLQQLADASLKFDANPEAPSDGAAQHDHYLYGTPKRDAD